jgi:hypothetical protein
MMTALIGFSWVVAILLIVRIYTTRTYDPEMAAKMALQTWTAILVAIALSGVSFWR